MTILQSKEFAAPSVWQSLQEAFLGAPRLLDCLQIEVSSYCMARCNYCPHALHQDSWENIHICSEIFANLWSLLRQTRRVHLQGWGEPFLNPRFFDFVEFVRRAGARVSTTSCGGIMTEEIAQKIVQSGLDIIAFSLTGTDEESNSDRIGLSFEKVCNNIKMLNEIRKKERAVHLEIHLAYLVLYSKRQALLRLPELLKKLDIHAAVISTLDYLPSPELACEAILPTDCARQAELATLIKQVKAEAEQEIYASLPCKEAKVNCRENIQKTAYIDAKGNISPCIYLNVPSKQACDRLMLGNVCENDGLDIWNSTEYTKFRQNFGAGKNISYCALCPKRFEVEL